MRKALLLLVGLASLLAFGAVSGSASDDGYGVRNCSTGLIICTEVADSVGANGAYTGHDEPSLLFYSDTAGSGNSNSYMLTLPTDPKTLPNQAGTGGTWNFQLRPAFWLGMAMCDTQSFPEFTNTCAADSDSNIF